jgi:hypothetical protein
VRIVTTLIQNKIAEFVGELQATFTSKGIPCGVGLYNHPLHQNNGGKHPEMTIVGVQGVFGNLYYELYTNNKNDRVYWDKYCDSMPTTQEKVIN